MPSEKPTLFEFSNELYDVTFSNHGASIVRLAYKGEPHKQEITHTVFYEGTPGLFSVEMQQDEGLKNIPFKFSGHDEAAQIFEFAFEKPGEYRLIKQYNLNNQTPVIGLKIILENLSSHEKHFPLSIHLGMNYELTRHHLARDFEVLASSEKIESANLDKVSKKGFALSKEMDWAGVVKKYFAILVKPDWKSSALTAFSDEKTLGAVLRTEPITVAAGAKSEHQVFIYAGPQRYEVLKSFDMGFEQILSRGIIGTVKIWLLFALKFCHRFSGNFGWAIILLTLFLKGLFTPLTHMSFESMKKMQALQPRLKSLQERFKNDPAKLNRETMELYRRNRVNPMAGCLPMLVQIPIFIAFYQVLNETIELKGAPFFGWIRDLSEPDRLIAFPFTLPFIGDSFNVLPLFMLASMYWQQKLSPQTAATPEQTKMFAFMPLIFGVLFYSMPSGLVLYWFVNNVLSIIHQVFVKRIVVVLHHEDRE